MSDIIPASRRGEAMGLLGTAGSLGMAAGPAIGGMLSNRISMDAVFYCASCFGLIFSHYPFGDKGDPSGTAAF